MEVTIKMVTVDFEKMQLEDIAYYLNTGKQKKRSNRYLRNENLLIDSKQDKVLIGSTKRRLNIEKSGTELFGGAII
jgi:hypothetical protein